MYCTPERERELKANSKTSQLIQATSTLTNNIGGLCSVDITRTEPRVPGLLRALFIELFSRESVASRYFEKGQMIRSAAYDPSGAFLAVGFLNGCIRILDAVTLKDEQNVFHLTRDTITLIVFSHDSQFMATADSGFTTSLFRRSDQIGAWTFLGRHRAHHKPVQDLMFGVDVDSAQPRLMSLGVDRNLVEYDLAASGMDDVRVLSTESVEQSAVPMCMTWYPPITKEDFLLAANSQFKFKLYNSSTKMCRKTLLGPTYGSPLQKLMVLPTSDPAKDERFLVFITRDKVGLNVLPLDGNPHNSMAMIAHPGEVADIVCSCDGKYVFTAGGDDSIVHMWRVNVQALKAQSAVGGEGLTPFYDLIDGGKDGPFYKEMVDLFYYAMIRSQGINAMDERNTSVKIAVSEVPFVMRALGFYPTEQEIDDMVNEVKFARYVETSEYMEEVDLPTFIRLYVNHRPAFGVSPDRILYAFEELGLTNDQVMEPCIDRGELFHLLQTRGEHMTEYELSECLVTLLGANEPGGSSELNELDTDNAGHVIETSIPDSVSASNFIGELLGFPIISDAEGQRTEEDNSAELTVQPPPKSLTV